MDDFSWINHIGKLTPAITPLIAIVGLPLVFINTLKALIGKKKLQPELEQNKEKVIMPPRSEYLMTGPLAIGAVLKGAEHQHIDDAYPTGGQGVHFVFSLYNPNKTFDFILHEVRVNVLSYKTLNLDHLTHGVGATDTQRRFRATVRSRTGSYVTTFTSATSPGEYVTIPPGKSENIDVEITTQTEGLYDVCLRIVGGVGGKPIDILLDSTKRQIAFFNKNAGYVVDRGCGTDMP